MKAYNLLTNRAYDVTPIKSWYYVELDGRYLILEPTDKQRKDVKDGYLYGHYDIDGRIYESLWTNSLDWVYKEAPDVNQMSIWELI